ncbi:MAG: hypothetical protein LUE92_05430 [Clostridiales bacterium]|nr:hypothetical protein [Clostridiales bacterium]
MSQFSEEMIETEDKGQYCRFVQMADGSYVLEPVKVPAHIIAEREERIRRREICRHAQENRQRAESINRGSVLFFDDDDLFFWYYLLFVSGDAEPGFRSGGSDYLLEGADHRVGG